MRHQIIAQEFPWEHAVCWLLFVPTFPITNNRKRVMAPKNLTGGDKKHFFSFIFVWPYFFMFFNRVIVFWPSQKCKIQFRTTNLTGGDKKHFFSFIFAWPYFLMFFNRVIVFWPSRKCNIQFRTNWSSGNFSTDLNKIMFLILLNYVLFTLTILLPGCMMESCKVVRRFTVISIQVYSV